MPPFRIRLVVKGKKKKKKVTKGQIESKETAQSSRTPIKKHKKLKLAQNPKKQPEILI